jgi:transposase-like protein
MTPPPACPFCGSGPVERVGQWGGQIITSQWRCNGCDSYFEAVRDDFASPEDLQVSVGIGHILAAQRSRSS